MSSSTSLPVFTVTPSASVSTSDELDFIESLKTHGWALVSLPTESVIKLKDGSSAVKTVLATILPDDPRCRFHHGLGVVDDDPTRRVFRMLTGNRAGAVLRTLGMSDTPFEIAAMCGELDRLCRDLADVICPALFDGSSSADIGAAIDLPLLMHAGELSKEGFGMVDFVQYKAGVSTKERDPAVHVADHADPGLFALSFVSEGEGLELRTEAGEWVPVPPRTCVVWLGSGAMDAGAKTAGWHRVVRSSTDRFAGWYEVIRNSQIHPDLVDKQPKRIASDATTTTTTASSSSAGAGAGSADSSSSHFTVEVKLLTGEAVPVRATASTTVADLKRELQDKKGIPPSKQRLVAGGKQLEDDKFLKSDYGLGDWSKVYMVLRLKGPPSPEPEPVLDDGDDFAVLIKWPDHPSFPAALEPTMTVGGLQKVVSDHTAVPMDGFVLVCNGERLTDQSTPLADTGVGAKDVVKMILKELPAPGMPWKLYVKTLTGKTVELDVTSTSRLIDVKQLMQDKEGIPPSKQRLIYAGIQLEDDDFLVDMGVKKDSTLHMVLRLRGGIVDGEFPVVVRLVTLRNVTVTMTETSTVADLKRLVMEKTGNDSVGRLEWKGFPLMDDTIVLADNGITRGSRILEKPPAV